MSRLTVVLVEDEFLGPDDLEVLGFVQQLVLPRVNRDPTRVVSVNTGQRTSAGPRQEEVKAGSRVWLYQAKGLTLWICVQLGAEKIVRIFFLSPGRQNHFFTVLVPLGNCTHTFAHTLTRSLSRVLHSRPRLSARTHRTHTHTFIVPRVALTSTSQCTHTSHTHAHVHCPACCTHVHVSFLPTPSRQCAAVRTQFLAMMVPPHEVAPGSSDPETATAHGKRPSRVVVPPTMRSCNGE